MGANPFLLILLLAILGYFVLYFTGRKYLENFKEHQPDEILNQTVYPPEKPYLTTPIYDLDDYELSVVFQNQSGKEASQKQISDAMSRYPMDWSVQPPNSQYFQDNQKQYEEQEKKKDAEPVNNTLYKQIDGSDLTPPDTAAIDEEERKILQTYKPESSKGLLSYSLEDVKHLIDRIYKKRGLVPTIEKSKQGQNVWEITEVQPEHPNIVWEDDLRRMTERERQTMRMEEVIEVPYTVTDIAAGLDPFFNPEDVSSRKGRYDYTKWTPGLERSFQSTYPIKSWF